ncbi:MAG: hypothetical protein K5868_05145 [Lachnospiraceae bacterium]|nr:hypothetical protein [Lachnospiraceae bacterium]
MKKYLDKNHISILLLLAGALVIIGFCLFQYVYYHSIRKVDISGYEETNADWTIEDIHWKDPDYDYITGKISINGEPVTIYPTRIVFYLDDQDTAYYIPVKMRNYIEPELEQKYAEEKNVNGFMFISKEYLTNAGEPSEASQFYCTIRRDNELRRTYKIGFLMDIDGKDYIVKTDELYAYYGIDQ